MVRILKKFDGQFWSIVGDLDPNPTPPGGLRVQFDYQRAYALSFCLPYSRFMYKFNYISI
jgi:hypothetical protein